ncbi:MAG: HEAT repeat domain-containing protein [Proteobacteria bacterium]|nr:HEAT repeat domain-containing protein [Pseudomonadota bacterium]
MCKLFSLAAQITAVFIVVFCSVGIAATADVNKEFEKIVAEPLSAKEKNAQLESFSKRFGVDALETLASQVSAHPKSETGQLAVRAIGMVGGIPAIETLTGLITQHKYNYAQFMIFTLSDIRDPEAVKQLRQLAVTDGPPEHRIAAAVALRWRGDAGDIEKMKEAAMRTKNRLIKQHLQLAVEAIEYRLTQLPESVSPQEWSGYQRRFWPEVMNPPQFRSIDMAYREAARRIVEKGELPGLFLKRFSDREIEGAQLVAVQIMGLQKQADEIHQFYNLAQRSDSLGKAGLNALIDVGNEVAVGLLGELLVKEGFAWPSIAVEGLVNIGTAQAAEVLERAAETTARKDLADYCRRGAARIRKKL